MPTARELLEQADALMRRNRIGAGRDAPARAGTPAPDPPTVSPAAGVAASPRTIQREPIAPSVARTSLPVDPTESPAFATDAPANQVPDESAADPPADERESAPEAEFPLLTEAIDAPATALAGPLDDLADDVPLLTDAVEEIDVGIVDEAARGEPSFWELTARGETSVLGPAPDSVVVVPPVAAAVPQSPPEGRDPLGLDQPPPRYPAPPETTEAEVFAADGRAESSPTPDPPAGPPAASDDVDEPPATGPSRGPDPGTHDEPGAWPPASAPDETAAMAPLTASPPGEDGYTAQAHEAWGGWPAAPSAEASPAPPVLPQVSELDQQRIREIAEEIGMQVLQRIDIFTDTTLRAQLGDRLRPVVDRAAADLVAAINEHVGELLRAQISEAIAREIESWRNNR